MILIGEAGGTKTEWRILDGDVITELSGAAFNAQSGNLSRLLSEVRTLTDKDPDAIHFYAAGMLADTRAPHLETFKAQFPHTRISLESDVLGAARSLFAKEPGAIGILGTGSAASGYDGTQLTSRVPSLGYILGDEGSGFDLGKRWVREYLRGSAPKDLADDFKQRHPEFAEPTVLEWAKDRSMLVPKVSSLTTFLKQNEHHSFVNELIQTSFNDYFKVYLRNDVKNLQWGFIGSVAFHFQDHLRKAAFDHGVHVKQIVPSAIDGLVNYHRTHG